MLTLGLVLCRPRIGAGRQLNAGGATALGVTVLLATGIVSLADLVDGFDALWRPFLTIASIMLTTKVAQQLGLFEYFARLIEPRPNRP